MRKLIVITIALSLWAVGFFLSIGQYVIFGNPGPLNLMVVGTAFAALGMGARVMAKGLNYEKE